MQNVICKCDECDMEKGDADGWFVVECAPWDFRITPWKYAQTAIGAAQIDREAEHICGQECLHKRLSQWLEQINRPAPANEGGQQQ